LEYAGIAVDDAAVGPLEVLDRESSDKISAIVGCDAPVYGRHRKIIYSPKQLSIAVSKRD
jgi:hypothetical protein